MTDPRIAALAEAMSAANVETLGWTPESAAAAILAALPPDWCGHEGLSLTEFQRLWAEDRAEIARLRKFEAEVPQLLVKIARYRRIEEAAREVANDADWDSAPFAFQRLRAALEPRSHEDIHRINQQAADAACDSYLRAALGEKR